MSSSWDDPSTLWICLVSVHFGLRISSSWDDPSILWTCFISVHFGLQIFILLGWFVHFTDLFCICPFGLQTFILLGWSVHFVDLFCIRLFWTSKCHPLGMISPLYGLVLYPSILDFKFSSFWDDPSTLRTCFVSVHFGLQTFILLGWSVHFVDLFCIRPFWTSKCHPLGMIRPHCGLSITYNKKSM